MRLIDADALEVFVKTVRQGMYLDKTLSDIPTRDSMLLNFQQYVHLQPTIDAVLVVYREWIHGCSDGAGTEFCYCSACGEDALKDKGGYTEFSRYCPNCGAKMDGEKEGV